MALPPARRFDPALRQRIVSSLVLAAAALVATVVGGWLFVALILVAVVVMAGEWSRLASEVPAPRTLPCSRRPQAFRPWPFSPWRLARRCRPWRSWPSGPCAMALLGSQLAGWHPLRAAGGALYVGVPALALVWLAGGHPGRHAARALAAAS